MAQLATGLCHLLRQLLKRLVETRVPVVLLAKAHLSKHVARAIDSPEDGQGSQVCPGLHP